MYIDIYLWQRPSNKIYYAAWEESGNTRRKTLKTADKRIANIRLNDFRRDYLAGKIKPIFEGSRTRLYKFIDEYLEHVSASTASSTYVQYDVALKKAKESWGDLPLSHIGERQIDKLKTDMLSKGLKVPTVNKILRHVKAALRKAYKWKYIKSPVEFPKFTKEEKALRFFSTEQLRNLSKVIDDREFADYCMLSAYSGLRSGEIIRLQWSDIDNPEGYLRISPKQKNKTESRIPINSKMRAIFRKCETRKHGKVFRFECLTWVSQKFKIACIAASLPFSRFHDLRHTFGAHLAMAGVDLVSIKELMRHESIESTMIYAKVSPKHLNEVSEKLNYGPMPVGKKKIKTAK